jgi:hypothetical protein
MVMWNYSGNLIFDSDSTHGSTAAQLRRPQSASPESASSPLGLGEAGFEAQTTSEAALETAAPSSHRLSSATPCRLERRPLELRHAGCNASGSRGRTRTLRHGFLAFGPGQSRLGYRPFRPPKAHCPEVWQIASWPPESHTPRRLLATSLYSPAPGEPMWGQGCNTLVVSSTPSADTTFPQAMIPGTRSSLPIFRFGNPSRRYQELEIEFPSLAISNSSSLFPWQGFRFTHSRGRGIVFASHTGVAVAGKPQPLVSVGCPSKTPSCLGYQHSTSGRSVASFCLGGLW